MTDSRSIPIGDLQRRSLTELANHHGSDKGTIGPVSGWPALNYTDIYEAYLGHLRDQPIRLLEIGLGVDGDRWKAHIAQGRNAEGGGSLKMWRDYFFKGKIYGVDINPAPFLNGERVKTFVVDQGDARDLAGFRREVEAEQFDVIIDDGSHRPDHQQVTLGSLFPLVKPGGMYFIEDLMNNGLGDPAHGRHSADAVLNTRKLLKTLKTEGTLISPHQIPNAQELVDTISWITFHCASVRQTAMPRLIRRLLRRLKLGSTESIYLENSEKLCAIRKVMRS